MTLYFSSVFTRRVEDKEALAHQEVVTNLSAWQSCSILLLPNVQCSACVSADLDPSRFWIPYDVTHCLGMRSSLKCRKVTYKMCVAHPRKWIRFLLAGTVLADQARPETAILRAPFESARLVCVCSYNNLCNVNCCRSASWSLSSCCDILVSV